MVSCPPFAVFLSLSVLKRLFWHFSCWVVCVFAHIHILAPKGHRSFSPWTFTPGLAQSLYPSDPYNIATSNAHVCLIPQIDSLKGVENCEIAAVEGISGLMFGPGDFMIESEMDLQGLLNGKLDPRFLEAMGRFGAAAQKNNIPVFRYVHGSV